jgi:hypothetical protein
MVGLVTQQHVGRHRLQVPRQPAEERPHPAAHGRRVLDEPVMVAEEVGDRRMGRASQTARGEAARRRPASRIRARVGKGSCLNACEVRSNRRTGESAKSMVCRVRFASTALSDAAPPWVFCFASKRQSNYAAARDGGVETRDGRGSRFHCLLPRSSDNLSLSVFSPRSPAHTGPKRPCQGRGVSAFPRSS